ncbi:MAG TPA: bacteriophage holin [Candidatus Sulfotelmatobacter sp.]|nr:bacteriophage holin [Candidatus Sulfotelmatobacter sp.]
MKVNTKALALASAVVWGFVMLAVGVTNLIVGNYGQQFLQAMSSVYPGYHDTRGIAEVIVGTLYGLCDGFIGGAVIAWLYNHFAKAAIRHEPPTGELRSEGMSASVKPAQQTLRSAP